MKLCCYTTNKMLTQDSDINDSSSPQRSSFINRRRRRFQRNFLVSSFWSRRENDNDNNNINVSTENLSVTSGPANMEVTNVVGSVPVVGMMSVTGRQREMEDAISVHMNLCRPEINGWQPVHYVGVFDGHGGPHVAGLCREKLHQLLIEELMGVPSNASATARGGSTSSTGGAQQEGFEEAWRRILNNCFQKMDEVAMETCGCGISGHMCDCGLGRVSLSGSTVVVAIITTEYIIVANCGDSRAVLSRGGTAIPLSVDQKPDREDERARIEAVGGRVLMMDGARVEGILAMSRAIGDNYLNPYVISEPEISFTKREAEDECLVLASDGLWDAMTNETACYVAMKCLIDEIASTGSGTVYHSRSGSAAALLTRLALGRKSSDNISVIVVDFKRGEIGG